MTERDRLAERFAALAAAAGQVILDVYARGCEARAKSDFSPVTEADERAEALILPGLAEILPGVPVVAEEQVARGAIPRLGRSFVLVDPLDGTREFLSGNGEFTVNIALVEAGRPVAGIVYAPVTGTAYLGGTIARRAHLPAGAAFDRGAAQAISTRPPPEALVAVASRSHADARSEAWLTAHGITGCTCAGSALKFGLIAEGLADVYPRFGPTAEWDVAAGDAVLTAAGGAVLTPEGERLTYGNSAARFINGPFIAWGRAPHTAT